MLYVIRDHMKQIVVAALAIAFVAIGSWAGISLSQAQAEEQPIEELVVSVHTEASGWREGASTPAIAKVTGTADDGERADYYHALQGNGDEEITLKPGEYSMTFISPVNEDGTFYKSPTPSKFDTATSKQGKISVAAVYAGMPAKSMTEQAISSLISEVTEATSFGDETLSGATAEDVLSTTKLYLATAAAKSGVAGGRDSGDLDWAGEEPGEDGNVRFADESPSGEEEPEKSADPDGNGSSSSSSSEQASTQAASAAALAAASSRNPSTPAPAREDQVRKWVAAVYEEVDRRAVRWVDDGDGSGHYEVVSDGKERKIAKAGHYE